MGRPGFAWLGCAAVLAGCASSPPRADTPAAVGRVFASHACAGCHAIAGPGPSPNARAPAFLELARRRSDSDLVSALAEISRNGHVEMPPVYITPDERRALVAYLRSLTARAT